MGKVESNISKNCCIVVLYNPNLEVIDNIKSYSNYFSKIILIDNSEIDNNNFIKSLKFDLKNAQFIINKENKGIAYALAQGMNVAINDGYKWCLTMDQDSKILLNNKDFEQIEKILSKNDKYGIISLNYNNSLKFRENQTIIDVKTWITSGNFININLYKNIKGFNKKLFIDYVDFDICRQFYEKNIPIGIINKSICHTIGEPIRKKFLFLKFNCMNHSPIRYYYRYRNSLYLFKKNKLFYIKIFLHEYIIDFAKMLFYENNKKEKIKMIKQGIIDAKNKKLGKYGDENDKI